MRLLASVTLKVLTAVSSPDGMFMGVTLHCIEQNPIHRDRRRSATAAACLKRRAPAEFAASAGLAHECLLTLTQRRRASCLTSGGERGIVLLPFPASRSDSSVGKKKRADPSPALRARATGRREPVEGQVLTSTETRTVGSIRFRQSPNRPKKRPDPSHL